MPLTCRAAERLPSGTKWELSAPLDYIITLQRQPRCECARSYDAESTQGHHVRVKPTWVTAVGCSSWRRHLAVSVAWWTRGD